MTSTIIGSIFEGIVQFGYSSQDRAEKEGPLKITFKVFDKLILNKAPWYMVLIIDGRDKESKDIAGTVRMLHATQLTDCTLVESSI